VPRILLADDDATQIDLRKTVLEFAGYQVQFALTVAAALRLIANDPADLVIMDLRFPNAEGKPDPAEGMAMIRRLRELGFAAPVIVLSGWPEELYGRPEELMISRILLKPVMTAALLAAVGDLIISPFGKPCDIRP
jgi:CheY-like chemotaxis protein